MSDPGPGFARKVVKAGWLAAWLVFGLGPLLVMFQVSEGKVTLNRTQFTVAAFAALVATGMAGVNVLGTLRAVRRLREHGITTDATIERVKETYVNVPSSYCGWVTRVKVTFIDTGGQPVHGSYTDHSRAAGRKQGQKTKIIYDPRKPTSLSPVDSSGASADPRTIDSFLMGVGGLVPLGVCVYFASRAFT